MNQRKLNFRMSQSNVIEFGNNMPQLGTVAFKEFSACGNIVKKVFYWEIAAILTGNRLICRGNRCTYFYMCSKLIAFSFRFKADFSNCCDRCKCFAPKTFCTDCKKVGGKTDLWGCMPLPAETGIGFRHSGTIVNYLNECTPGIFYIYSYNVSTGINSIFNQFLYNGSRSLNNLSRSNLVGYRIR